MNMVKLLSFRLNECFGRFTMLLVEASSQEDFLDNYLTTPFWVRNFLIAEALKVTFFLKCSKYNIDLKNAENNAGKRVCV